MQIWAINGFITHSISKNLALNQYLLNERKNNIKEYRKHVTKQL